MAELLYINRIPLKLRTGDCVYRALSWFLGVSWREALDDIVGWCADRGIVRFNYKGTINILYIGQSQKSQLPFEKTRLDIISIHYKSIN